jgi:hypothetical protein
MSQKELGVWAKNRWNLPNSITQGGISKILKDQNKWLNASREQAILKSYIDPSFPEVEVL